MKLSNLIITTLCLYAALTVSSSRSEGLNESGSINSSSTTENETAKIMGTTLTEKLNKSSYSIPDTTMKTLDEEPELNHLNDSSIIETKDTDANLELQREKNNTYVDGENDLKGDSTDNSDNSESTSSKSSYNETVIVFLNDNEKVENVAEELEENLEKFEEFEAGLSNSSNVNDSKNVGDTTTEVMNNTDIDGKEKISQPVAPRLSPQLSPPVTLNVSENEVSTSSTESKVTEFLIPVSPEHSNISMENIAGKKNDVSTTLSTTTVEFEISDFYTSESPESLNISTETFEGKKDVSYSTSPETEVDIQTTEFSVTKFLTPKSPEPRSIPINGFNVVKDDITNSSQLVSTIDIPVSSPSAVEIVENELQIGEEEITTLPVGDITNNAVSSQPELIIDKPVLVPSEEVEDVINKLQSVQEEATLLPVEDFKTESVPNSSTTNTVESKLPSEKGLKLDTAKIDQQTNDYTNSFTTEENKGISDESRKNSSSEDVSLTNDFKKNESSTDFHEIDKVPEIHEVIETLGNENSTLEDTIVCPKGYRCIPLNQTSQEVCLSLTNVYVLSGSVAGFLVLAVIAIYLKLRRRNNSSSLYDIPHLNIKSDYNLTPIPRPSINHPDREYVPAFGTETYSRARGEESLSQRHFNDTLPNEFMELKNVPSNTRLHTFGRSASGKSNATSACNEYYSLDTWKDKEPLRKQGAENLAFRKW